MTKNLPKALKPGDRIGMIGPSGSFKDNNNIYKAAKAIESMGFSVQVGDSCKHKYGYLASKDELRAKDINDFFADDGIDGIICMKGGYGTPRILDKLDYAVIASHPKVFAGYSDITALHLAFARYANFPSFHTPMAISIADEGFDSFSLEAMKKCIMSTEPLGRLLSVTNSHNFQGFNHKTIVPGKAVGRLIGGNLSLVAAMTGTPYSINPEGAIIFLEDVNEEPYRIDRMLSQLRLAGVFNNCEGIVLGDFKDCNAKEPERSLTLEEVFMDILAPIGKPCFYGFAAGHSLPTLSFPLGVGAILDADAGFIEITEASLKSNA